MVSNVGKTLYAHFAGSERSGESADDKDQLSAQLASGAVVPSRHEAHESLQTLKPTREVSAEVSAEVLKKRSLDSADDSKSSSTSRSSSPEVDKASKSDLEAAEATRDEQICTALTPKVSTRR